MTMKKTSKQDDQEVENIARANCLKLLSRVGYTSRLYRCKLCNRQFSSFQALGGHRASHKRLRASSPLASGRSSTDDGSINFFSIVSSPPAPPVPADKAKIHGCSICGAEFPIGQALGGHMRRHRNNVGPISKKCGVRRDGYLWFDLNLTPHENDVEFAKRPPILDCFLLADSY